MKALFIGGTGTISTAITHNTDFAKAFVGLMGNKHAIGESFHITSDENLTWNQIHEIIAAALGVELKPYHIASDLLAAIAPHYDLEGNLIGDKANTVIFDNSKVKRAVPGFVATTRFDQGIHQTIDYILSHPEQQVEDPEFDAWCDRVIATLEGAKRSLM